MTLNESYTNEYLAAIEALEGDAAGRAAARDAMEHSTAIYHHDVVDSSYVPRLYDKASRDYMQYVAETTYRILEKVMTHYLENPAYRHVYDLDPRLQELILLPRDYDALLPFARFDIFLDENALQAQFCEFNADGSSGMNENREIHNSIMNSAPYQAFCKNHSVQGCTDDLFAGWIDEFLKIYDTYAFKVENPHVAIVDFLENAVVDEFVVFAKLFEARGVQCSVYDVRELAFDGDRLIGRHAHYGRDDAPINAIWRRSVTNDVIDHWDESQQLIEAVRRRTVALIGSFAGHLVHDKQIFQVLFAPETKALLTDEENAFVAATVPFTGFLDERFVDLDAVKANRAAWIIKPTDAYGAQDVYAGQDYSDEQWAALVDRFANEASGAPFLVQRYITPFKTLALPLYGCEDDYSAAPQAYNNLQGLYVYNGSFKGVFSRLGPNPVICKRTRGITAATLWVDC